MHFAQLADCSDDLTRVDCYRSKREKEREREREREREKETLHPQPSARRLLRRLDQGRLLPVSFSHTLSLYVYIHLSLSLSQTLLGRPD